MDAEAYGDPGKKVPIEGMDVGHWRIDDVLYPDGTDMKAALVSAFEGYGDPPAQK